MSKFYFILNLKYLFTGIFALFFHFLTIAQVVTAIDQKGNMIEVRNTAVTTAATAPSYPVQNDIWFDTSANLTKIYNGTIWLIINENALGSKEELANKSADVTLADDTNTKFPTELAVKTYVDEQIAATADDDITAVSFDGTVLTLEEGLTTFSTDISSLINKSFLTVTTNNTPSSISDDIFTQGKVGINTTTPDAQLDIESNGVPLRIAPSISTPTGTNGGQIFIGNDGILYSYDADRAKWLSVDRNMVGWGNNSSLTTNQYLRQFGSALSSNNGWRMIRNATITAVAAQTNGNESWTLEIRKNNNGSAIASLNISSSQGGHDNSLNIDIDEGDFLQAYCNGFAVNSPQTLIEIAWRK